MADEILNGTLGELGKTVQDEILQGVIETIIDTDDVFRVLSFRKVTGSGLKVTWEKEIPTAGFMGPTDTIPQSPGTTLDQFTETIKVIARNIDIPRYATEVMGAPVIPMIQGEIKAMSRAYRQAMFTGDSTTNPAVFDGLKKQVERIESKGLQRSIDAAGDSLTFKHLDQLLALMKIGVDAIIMHPKAYIAYKELLRKEGKGTDSAMLQLKNFGKPVLTFDGVPILRSEFAPLTTDGGNVFTDIYGAYFSVADGVTGLYGGNGGAGIQYRKLGEVPDKIAVRYRFEWFCGFTVLSPYAVAVVKNVKVE
jgi:HK97 family phage major capsid protein